LLLFGRSRCLGWFRFHRPQLIGFFAARAIAHDARSVIMRPVAADSRDSNAEQFPMLLQICFEYLAATVDLQLEKILPDAAIRQPRDPVAIMAQAPEEKVKRLLQGREMRLQPGVRDLPPRG
jgi:hypothetical protein